MRLELERPAPPPPGAMDIVPMTEEHLRDVLRIETLCFSSAWPQNAFSNEVRDNKLAHYFVGSVRGETMAYGGLWVILEDSHITTIAVTPQQQRRGYGEIMLLRMLDCAVERGASWITLEVRESNIAAQNLYRKYGFSVVSTRRAYYSDNNENALVMWAGNIRGELYLNRLAARRAALVTR